MAFVEVPQQRGRTGWMRSPGLHPWHREHHRDLVPGESHPCSLGITPARRLKLLTGWVYVPSGLFLSKCEMGESSYPGPSLHQKSHLLSGLCPTPLTPEDTRGSLLWQDSRTAPPDWQTPPGTALRWSAGWRRFLSCHFLGRKRAFLIIIAQQLSNHFSYWLVQIKFQMHVGMYELDEVNGCFKYELIFDFNFFSFCTKLLIN